MVQISTGLITTTILLSSLLAIASAQAGTQFITGPCLSDADCASSCCGFNTGKCAGPVIAQTRDGGCGFGNATPNDIAAQGFLASETPGAATAGAAAAAATNPTAVENLTSARTGASSVCAGNAAGTQFTTGECTGDVDCASLRCGFNTGKCAAPVVAQERDGGSGFGDAVPNDDAARRLRGRLYAETTTDDLVWRLLPRSWLV